MEIRTCSGMGNCKAYAPHATAGPKRCRNGMDTARDATWTGCRSIPIIRGGKGQNELLTVRRKIDEKAEKGAKELGQLRLFG